MLHDIVIKFAGATVPAGYLECQIDTSTKAIEANAHGIEAGSASNQAIALKSLVFRLCNLARDLGYTVDLTYVVDIIAGSERDMRDAYAAAVEMY